MITTSNYTGCYAKKTDIVKQKRQEQWKHDDYKKYVHWTLCKKDGDCAVKQTRALERTRTQDNNYIKLHWMLCKKDGRCRARDKNTETYAQS